MKDTLRVIAEEFDYLNEEKRKIESKPLKTEKDFEDLKAIENLYQYMQEKLNNWATEKNNQIEETEIEEEDRVTVLNNRISEIEQELKKLEMSSKELQPRIDIHDKKIKDQVLEMIGYIRTGTINSEEVVLHPSVVGKYFDLVKEYKNLKAELEKETKTQFIEPLEPIDPINYWDLPRFNPETKVESNSEFDKLNELINEGMKKDSPEIEVFDGPIPIITEEDKKEEEYEIIDVVEEEKQVPAIVVPEEKQVPAVIVPSPYEYVSEPEKEEEPQKGIKGFITKIRKPEKKEKIKNWFKKQKTKLIAVVTAIAMFGTGFALGRATKNDNDIVNNQIQIEQSIENTEDKIVDDEIISAIDEEIEKMEEEKQNNEIKVETEKEETQEDSISRIGNVVTVQEGTRIHNNEYDAYLGENSYSTYYKYDTERSIVGVAIIKDNKMNTVFASDENYNEKVNNLVENGGEIVSVLTANKKYLEDWDGKTPLSLDEIRAYNEGWYNVNDLTNNNVKGIQR